MNMIGRYSAVKVFPKFLTEGETALRRSPKVQKSVNQTYFRTGPVQMQFVNKTPDTR